MSLPPPQCRAHPKTWSPAASRTPALERPGQLLPGTSGCTRLNGSRCSLRRTEKWWCRAILQMLCWRAWVQRLCSRSLWSPTMRTETAKLSRDERRLTVSSQIRLIITWNCICLKSAFPLYVNTAVNAGQRSKVKESWCQSMPQALSLSAFCVCPVIFFSLMFHLIWWVWQDHLLLFSASAAHKKLVVSDETEQTMKVTWAPAPGGVSHYRLKYVPSGGGKEVALKVPGSVTSTVMKRLQPVTTYNITVEPIYKHGEGKARQGVGTTRTLVHNSTVWQSLHHRHTSPPACRQTVLLALHKLFTVLFPLIYYISSVMKLLLQVSSHWSKHSLVGPEQVTLKRSNYDLR